MADEGFGFLTEKLGPMPVWMWAGLAVGGYYWYEHYGPGASSSADTSGTTTGTTDIQTQDTETVPGYGGSQYKTNAEWEAAAINYLVGESVPPDQASTAIWNYLHSKDLTTQEQQDVNLAIEGIGPPPQVPAPASPVPVDHGPKPPLPKPHPRKPVPEPHPQPKPRRPGPEPGPHRRSNPGGTNHPPKPKPVRKPKRKTKTTPRRRS